MVGKASAQADAFSYIHKQKALKRKRFKAFQLVEVTGFEFGVRFVLCGSMRKDIENAWFEHLCME